MNDLGFNLTNMDEIIFYMYYYFTQDQKIFYHVIQFQGFIFQEKEGREKSSRDGRKSQKAQRNKVSYLHITYFHG